MAYPIVLVHGIARFDSLITSIEYWSFIPNLLRSAGYTVFEADLVTTEACRHSTRN